jgi:branched-chain amino acid transport system substrate-binding protein
MTPRHGRWGRVGAVLVVLGLAAGCGPAERQDHSPVSASSTTIGPVVTIRIGYLGDLAHGGTVVSKAVQDGERLAVQQFAGSGHNVNVLIETASTNGTTAGAASAAKTLVADHVAAVIGPQSTKEALGAGPVLAQAGIPELSPTVTSTTLPTTWSGFFRVVADDTQQGTAEADELVNNLGRRQVALVGENDPDDQARITAAVAQVAADKGTVTTTLTASSTGPSPAVTDADQVLASGADGVLISEAGPLARSLVSDLEADGFQGSILLAADATVSPGVLDSLGTSADGAYEASPANDTSTQASSGGSALEFRDTYRAAFGRVPPPWAAESYDATNFVLAGIEGGATSSGPLASYLSGHSWAGISETLNFATGGIEAHPKVWISQIQDGVLTQLSSVS